MRTHRLLEGDLWAERDAQNRGETERMMRELRDNLRSRFSGPAVEYAKAAEVELNALIFPSLRQESLLR